MRVNRGERVRSKWLSSVVSGVVLTLAAFPNLSQADTAAGYSWLSTQQAADGSFRTQQALALPPQATLEAIRAIRLSDQTTALSSAIAFLGAETSDSTEARARKIIAFFENGSASGPDVDALLAAQNSDGGFGQVAGYSSSVLDSSFALEALALAQPVPNDAIGKVVGYLTEKQRQDGSWQDQEGNGAIYVSAVAMRALWTQRNKYALGTYLTKAQNYLLGQRLSNAWGEVHDTSLALVALLPYLADRSQIASSLQALRDAQAANGSWLDDVFSTSLALRALSLSESATANPDAATISAVVSDSQTGATLSGVTAALTGASSATQVSGADGRIQFTGLSAPENYQLSFSKTDYSTLSTSISVRAGSQVNLGNLQMTKVQETEGGEGPTTGTVTGTAKNADSGESLAGVEVIVNGSLTAVTGSNGVYQISNVTPGNVTVVAQKSGFSSVHGSGSVSAGGVMVFSFGLSPQAQPDVVLQGLVVEASSNGALQGASVVLSGANSATTTTGSDGRYRLTGLSTGSTTVAVSKQGYDSALVTTTLEANSATEFSPKLYGEGTTPTGANASKVIGQVLDSVSGGAIQDVQVVATWAGGSKTVLTDATGYFEVTGISGISASGVTLEFSKAGYVKAKFATAIEESSSLDVGDVRLKAEGIVNFQPDLVVDPIDSLIGLSTDPQTLHVQGTITVTARNSGTASTSAPFEVAVFADINANQIVDDGELLGQTTVGDLLSAGGEKSLTVAVGGQLPFRGYPLTVVADAGQTVLELAEGNNAQVSVSDSALVFEKVDGVYKTYGFNPRNNGSVLLAGIAPTTAYTVRAIPSLSVLQSGTLSRLQSARVQLGGTRGFVIESSEVLFAQESHDYYNGTYVSLGGHFFPSKTGVDYYATEMIILPVNNNWVINGHPQGKTVVFAYEDAVVSIYDKNNTLRVTSPQLTAGSYWLPTGMVINDFNIVRATGRVAVQHMSPGGSYSQVPPVPEGGCAADCRDDAGSRFYFSTLGWWTGSFAVMNPTKKVVRYSVRDMQTGAMLFSDVEIAPGQLSYQDGMGTRYLELTATAGLVTVWAGDNEGGRTVADMGDDLSQNFGLSGRAFTLHSQTEGLKIISGQNDTEVVLNGEQRIDLQSSGIYEVPSGSTYTITSNKPISIFAIGGTCCYPFNDWSKVLRPSPSGIGSASDLTASWLRVERQSGSLNLTARIGNAGLRPSASGALVGFYAGSPRSGGTLLGQVALGELQSGAYSEITLSGVSANLSSTEIYVVADSDDRVSECDEGNNVHHIAMPTESAQGTIAAATDSSSYPPNWPAQLLATVHNTGTRATDFQVQFLIEDAAGERVAEFPLVNLTSVAAGATVDATQGWNVSATRAGPYLLRARLRQPSPSAGVLGDVIAESTASFNVVSGTAVASLRTSTDRRQYHISDRVQVRSVVNNPSSNASLSGASYDYVVRDGSGTPVATYHYALPELPANGSRSIDSSVVLNRATIGEYGVDAKVVDQNGSLIAQTMTIFQVQNDPARSISGVTTVDTASITQGTEQRCVDTVHNDGTQVETGIALRQAVIRLSDGEVIHESERAVDLAASGSNAQERRFATGALQAGDYACTLEHNVDNVWRSLSYATFSVTASSEQSFTVSGRVLVASPSVQAGIAQTCTDEVTNTGTTAINDLPIRQSLRRLTDGSVLTQSNTTVSLAAGNQTQLTRNVSTQDFEAGDYACVLEAGRTVSGQTEWQELGRGTFSVTAVPQGPKVDVDLTASDRPRVLALIDRLPTSSSGGGSGTGCIANQRIELIGDWRNGGLPANATVHVEVRDANGTIVDTEDASIAGFQNPKDGNAGINGVNLLITGFTQSQIQFALPRTGSSFPSPRYQFVATAYQGSYLQQLNSGVVFPDCQTQTTDNGTRYQDFRVVAPQAGPADPEPATLEAKRAYLQGVLTELGYAATIVTDVNAFRTAFHTNSYTGHLLLSNALTMDERLQKELTEAAYRGKPLVKAGLQRDSNSLLFALTGQSLLGETRASAVDVLDPMLGNPGSVSLPTSSLVAQSQAVSGVQPAATVWARYASGGTGTAVSQRPYGLGQVVYAGFDLLELALRQGSATLRTVLAGSLKQPPPPPLTGGDTTALALQINNADTRTWSGEGQVQLPTGVALVDAGDGYEASASEWRLPYYLVAGAASTGRFWTRLPETGGSLSFAATALVDATSGSTTAGTDSLSLSVTPRPTLADAKTAAQCCAGLASAREQLDLAEAALAAKPGRALWHLLEAARLIAQAQLSDNSTPLIDARLAVAAVIAGLAPQVAVNDPNFSPPASPREVLSFESLTAWRAENGTALSLDTTNRTDPAASLSVPVNGYIRLLSKSFRFGGESSLPNSTQKLAVDMQIPTSQTGWPGNLEIVLRIPSKQIWWEVLGQRDLNGITKGSFTTQLFDLTGNARSALQQEPTDVEIIINLNAGATSDRYLLDNLRLQ